MKIQAAAVCIVAATFAVGAVRAHAQGPPAVPGAAASLTARIEALEARLAALETIDESDVVGNYKWQMLGIELNRGFSGTPGTPARVNSEAGDIVITLNADHTVQVSRSGTLRCTLPVLTFGIASCQPLSRSR